MSFMEGVFMEFLMVVFLFFRFKNYLCFLFYCILNIRYFRENEQCVNGDNLGRVKQKKSVSRRTPNLPRDPLSIRCLPEVMARMSPKRIEVRDS